MTVELAVQGWQAHFAAADRALKWLEVEKPVAWRMARGVFLVGVIDTIGENQDGLFFGEWKTASPFEKATWKQVWRKNIQSLTYAALVQGGLGLDCYNFTVRKCFKERNGSYTYDHAWFSYRPEEVNEWVWQIRLVAQEIIEYLENGHSIWPTNFNNCFRYGPKYVCPLFEVECSQDRYNKQSGTGASWLATVPPDARPWLGEILYEMSSPGETLVVLSATALATWFGCRQRFKRVYYDGFESPATEAMEFGTEVHKGLAEYYRSFTRPSTTR